MTRRPGRFTDVVLVVVAALATVSTGVPLGAPSAGAHGSVGTLGIEATATGPSTVRVRTLLRYATDGHTVPGATVTVVADGPAGQTVGPVTLSDTGDGTYAVDLALPAPGAWAVTASAVDPAAEARTVVTVGGTPPTTVRDRPATTPPTAAESRSADPDRPTDDPLVPVVKYLVVVLGVAIVTATLVVGFGRRRRR